MEVTSVEYVRYRLSWRYTIGRLRFSEHQTDQWVYRLNGEETGQGGVRGLALRHAGRFVFRAGPDTHGMVERKFHPYDKDTIMQQKQTKISERKSVPGKAPTAEHNGYLWSRSATKHGAVFPERLLDFCWMLVSNDDSSQCCQISYEFGGTYTWQPQRNRSASVSRLMIIS